LHFKNFVNIFHRKKWLSLGRGERQGGADSSWKKRLQGVGLGHRHINLGSTAAAATSPASPPVLAAGR